MNAIHLKPVSMDVVLDYHEKLLQTCQVGLRDTKRKLHETELMISLEPPKKGNDEDNYEWVQWDKSVNEIMKRKVNRSFPSLAQMKKDNEMKKMAQKDLKRKKTAASREAWARQAQVIMQKQTKSMQEKVLQGKGKFGDSIEGEVIGSIENYYGCNSIHTGKRTLIRKNGRIHDANSNESLPPWIGPQFYEIPPQALDPHQKSTTYYQIPFKAPPRKHHGSTVSIATQREETSRRRKQLMSEGGGEDTFMNFSLSSRPVTTTVKSFKDVLKFDEEDDVLKEEEDESFDIGDDSGINEHAPHNSLADSSSYSFDESERSRSTILQLPSISQRRFHDHHKAVSIPAQRPSHKQRFKHKVALDPIITNHSYALKILNSENDDRRRSRMKDYTYNAFANQTPNVYATFNNDESMLATSTVSTSKPGTSSMETGTNSSAAGSKFTSDIFKKPTVEYRTSEQLMKESQVKFNASHLVPDPFSSSSVKVQPMVVGTPNTGRVRTASSNGSPPSTSSRRPTSGQALYGLTSALSTKSMGALVAVPNPGLSMTANELAKSDSHMGDIIKTWCKERNVYLSKDFNRYKKEQVHFSREKAKVVAIKELSLDGLLLEEDTSVTHPDLIFANQYKDLDHIVL